MYSQLQLDTVWTKTFKSGNTDIARKAIQTKDKGFAVIGRSLNPTLGFVAHLVKTDSLGNKEWSKNYGQSISRLTQPTSILQLEDEGYIIAGETHAFDSIYCINLIRTNSVGDIIWTSLIGTEYDEVHSGFYSNCIAKTSDGGFAVIGSMWLPKRDVILFKVDSLGKEVWNKSYGGSSGDFGTAIQATIDGGYMLSGFSYSYGYQNGKCDGWLIKIDEDGNIQWKNIYGGENYDSFYNVIQTNDGGFLAVGITESYGNTHQAYVVKIDELGNEQWSKALGGEGVENFIGVCQTTDNGYLLSGTTTSIGAGMYDIYIVKLNNAGDLLYKATFGGSLDDFGSSILKINDFNYIFCGSVSFTGCGESYSLIQFKEEENYPPFGRRPADFIGEFPLDKTPEHTGSPREVGDDSGIDVIISYEDYKSTKTDNGSITDFNYTITRRWSLKDNKNAITDLGDQLITCQDTQAPVYVPETNSFTDNSSDSIERIEEIEIGDICKPDTTITIRGKDISGNISEPFTLVKEAEYYSGHPYLVEPDPYSSDTLQLNLGQEETPENLGGWPDYIDDKTEVTSSFTTEEIEWLGNGWLKKIIFNSQNECGNSSEESVIRFYLKPSGTGIEGIRAEGKFLIYPNPAKEFITISWDGFPTLAGRHPYSLEIVDLTGRIIFEKKLNTQNFVINTSAYSIGVYLLKIHDGKKIILQEKIVIQ